MTEFSHSAAIGGNDMAIAYKLILVSRQAFESHRTSRMQFAGADTYFRTQAIAIAIAESSGSVVVDAGGVDLFQEARGSGRILSHDCFGVSTAELLNVLQSLVQIINNSYR